MNKHQLSDLAQMQSLPLSAKIRMTQQRIRDWYDYWDGDVYISFSGGKDSTVLVDIITKMGMETYRLDIKKEGKANVGIMGKSNR